MPCNDSITKQFNNPAYQLLEKIGEGGFAYVYRAVHNNTKQIVAIKFLIISPLFNDQKKERLKERFERETQVGTHLHHPNIVRLLDKGNCGDLLYAVFEYIDGKTLKDTLAECHSLSATETITIMAQVLDALAYAHQLGVIHRDIKPANIMLSRQTARTHVKVLDFGIAIFVNSDTYQNNKNITLTQESIGTPSYSSPEQLRGEPTTVKSDLYVWGLVFIECLTGQPAISGVNLASVYYKQLAPSTVPLPIAIVNHPLAGVLRRVLHKKADQRSGDAQLLCQNLLEIDAVNIVGDISAVQAQKSEPKIIGSDYDEGEKTIITHKAKYYSGIIERKQITILSMNLSAFAYSNQNIYQEVVDTLLYDYKNQCIDTAVNYGAYYVGSLADNLLFYFGYPQASFNDCRLAARSALDIISRIQKRNALLKHSQHVELITRIGIHTGMVNCYSGTVPKGHAVNIAMHLAHRADKNKILCTDVSQKILRNHIEFKAANSLSLGIDAISTPLFNLIAERHVEALGFLTNQLTPQTFVGREQELQQLTKLSNETDIGTKNKLVHVYGEAGIGKSRLMLELRKATKNNVHFVANCLPEHKNNALHPILSVIKNKYSLDLLSPEDAVTALHKIIVELSLKKKEVMPLLCAWLNLPTPEEFKHSPLKDYSKEFLFDALIRLISYDFSKDLSYKNLFIIEDLHWADPTTFEFIDYFTQDEYFLTLNVFFVSTSRNPLSSLLNVTNFQTIQLEKLTGQSICDYVRILFDKESISQRLLDLMTMRTDGIPLFIEELVNMLKQKHLVRKLNGIIDLTEQDNFADIPNTLRDSLQQKLDELLYAKKTAQLAATIGREFDYKLLIAASCYSEEEVQRHLDKLITAKLIYLQRKVTGDSYLFKHVLIKDVAYESIGTAYLEKEHSRLANAMIKLKINEPMVIAKHLALAKRYTEAVDLGLRTAKNALVNSLSQSAYDIAHQALQWNDLRKDDAQKIESSLNLLSVSLPAIMTVAGMGSTKVGEEIEQCERVLAGLNEFTRKTLSKAQLELERRTKYALISFYNFRSVRYKANILAKELLKQAIKEKDIELEIAIRSIQGSCYYMEGHYIEAKETLERAIFLYDPQKQNKLALKYSLEPETFCNMTLSLVLWMLGYADKAVEAVNNAYQRAYQLKHHGSQGMANSYLGLVAYFRNEPENILRIHSINKQLCEKYPDIERATMGAVNSLKDWVEGQTTHVASFIAERKKANEYFAIPFYEAILADIKIKQGKHKAALQVLTQTIDWCYKSGEYLSLSMLYRIQAKAYLTSDQYHICLAISSLNEAISIAKEQKSIALELDASVDLCQILKSQQRMDKIPEILAPLLNKFSEGFTTKIFQEAEQLLLLSRQANFHSEQ